MRVGWVKVIAHLFTFCNRSVPKGSAFLDDAVGNVRQTVDLLNLYELGRTKHKVHFESRGRTLHQ